MPSSIDFVQFVPQSAGSRALFGRVSFLPSPPVDAPPTISNITPTPGTPISQTQVINFEVTSPVSRTFTSIIVLAAYPSNGIYEVLHDGVRFSNNYTGTRTVISGGYSYNNVLRIGGWPSTLNLTINAVDSVGQENS